MAEFGWMFALLIFLLIACIVIWGAQRLMAAWSIGEPIRSTVYVILVVIFGVALVMRLGAGLAVF